MGGMTAHTNIEKNKKNTRTERETYNLPKGCDSNSLTLPVDHWTFIQSIQIAHCSHMIATRGGGGGVAKTIRYKIRQQTQKCVKEKEKRKRPTIAKMSPLSY